MGHKEVEIRGKVIRKNGRSRFVMGPAIKDRESETSKIIWPSDGGAMIIRASHIIEGVVPEGEDGKASFVLKIKVKERKPKNED